MFGRPRHPYVPIEREYEYSLAEIDGYPTIMRRDVSPAGGTSAWRIHARLIGDRIDSWSSAHKILDLLNTPTEGE